MRFPRTSVILLLLVLLAFVLRVYRLDFFSLRGDEAFTVLFVQKPLAQMWEETLTVEPNPPLLYFLLRWWIELAGSSEWVTRFFSLWFGVLSVPLIYRAGREIFSSTAVALIAAFLLAINPYQIWHSQDVRNYTLWPLFSIAALFFFWQWYKANNVSLRGTTSATKQSQRANHNTSVISLLWFSLAQLTALYAHYYEAFILLALNLFVFVTLWRDHRKIVEWLVSQVVLALLYLPYPLILSNRVSSYGEGSGRMGVPLWDVARESFSSFLLSDTLDENLRAWLWIPFALVALAGLVILFTRDWRRGLFFLMYTAVPTLAVFALNTLRPLYLERYLNGIAPAYYLLVAFGIVALAQGIQKRISAPNGRVANVAMRVLAIAAILLVAFLALANYWNNPVYAKAPAWRELTDIINANAQPGDIIVQNFPEMSLLYYDSTQLPLVVYPETYLPDTKTTQQLNAMNANYQRVWFIPAAEDYWDPNQYVESWLDRRTDLLQESPAGNFRLRLYATPSSYLNTMQKSDAQILDLVALRGYRTAVENDALRTVFFWRALKKPGQDYEIKVQTLDAAGNVLGEQQSAPVDGAYPTSQWRENELVVDQHLVANSAGAVSFNVLLCGGDLCYGAGPLPIVPTN